MRWGYSPVTHRTVVSYPLRRLSGVHDAGGGHPLMIPRRDVHCTRPERAIRNIPAGGAVALNHECAMVRKLSIRTQLDSERGVKLPPLRTGYFNVLMCAKKTGV